MKRSTFRQIWQSSFPKICGSLFALASLMAGGGLANGQSTPQHLTGREYIVSAATVSVAWDLVPIAAGYEARLALFMKEPVTYYALARIPGTENNITFYQPRAGHFRAEVRACRFADCHCEPDANLADDCANDLSAWAESTNKAEAQVDGEPMAWWIYWKVPKPILE